MQLIRGSLEKPGVQQTSNTEDVQYRETASFNAVERGGVSVHLRGRRTHRVPKEHNAGSVSANPVAWLTCWRNSDQSRTQTTGKQGLCNKKEGV